MKIERKENSGLVEFGSLGKGEVFGFENSKIIWTKILDVKTDDERNTVYINCIDTEGKHGFVIDKSKVKHYPNAKLVLED